MVRNGDAARVRDVGSAARVPGSAGAVSPAASADVFDRGGEGRGQGSGRGSPDALRVAEGPADGRTADEGAAGTVQEAGGHGIDGRMHLALAAPFVKKTEAL